MTSSLRRLRRPDEASFPLPFRENFKKFEAFASEEIRRGGPQRYAF